MLYVDAYVNMPACCYVQPGPEGGRAQIQMVIVVSDRYCYGPGNPDQ